MDDEDLIQREDMVVTVTHEGYIKRVPLSIYRAQARGGKGRSGMSTKDDGFRHAAVRCQHAHAGSVLLLARHRLQGKGLAPADRHAAIARQGADQHAADRNWRPHHRDHAAAGGRGRSGANLDVMFATTRGTVRRNKLSDFVQVNRNGKIAMKFDEEGDAILAVETCTENDDVLLTADSGQCIRFPVTDVRVFAGRSSQGVRGISMADTDRAISMTILEHVDADAAERAAYLKRSVRRTPSGSGEEEEIALTNEEVGEEAQLTDERYEFLRAHEQFVLTVTEYGYGKRSSSYDFRLTGRGGKGIRATDVSKIAEIGKLVATFPVADRRPDHAGFRRRAGDPRAGQAASASPAARRRA